jgi:hypothetical protein
MGNLEKRDHLLDLSEQQDLSRNRPTDLRHQSAYSYIDEVILTLKSWRLPSTCSELYDENCVGNFYRLN